MFRQTRHAFSRNADGVTLTLGDGILSNELRALGLGKMMKYEYVLVFQSALYALKPMVTLVGMR